MLPFITRMFSPLTDVCRVIGRISALQRGNTSTGDLKSLITYYSLSHYTGISHATLASLYPGDGTTPTPARAITVFLQQLVKIAPCSYLAIVSASFQATVSLTSRSRRKGTVESRFEREFHADDVSSVCLEPIQSVTNCFLELL